MKIDEMKGNRREGRPHFPVEFHQRFDVEILGKDKKFYRGQIDVSRSLTTKKEIDRREKKKISKKETERNEFERIDFSIETKEEKYLHEYFLWLDHFRQQVRRRRKSSIFLFRESFRFFILRIRRTKCSSNSFNIGRTSIRTIDPVSLVLNRHRRFKLKIHQKRRSIRKVRTQNCLK